MTVPSCGRTGEALLRAGIFGAIAGAFCYPAQDLPEAMESRWTRLLEWDGEWPDAQRSVLAAVLEALQAADPALLANEHIRLFGPSAQCPLTETSWGDSARLLGKAFQLADISGFYCAFDVRPRVNAGSVPEDHLLMELEFMSILYLKEAYAVNSGLEEELLITRDAQKKFLEEHLATWIDYWAERLRACAPAPFYRELAAALKLVIHAETARLGLAPIPIRARVADHTAGGDTLDCPFTATS